MAASTTSDRKYVLKKVGECRWELPVSYKQGMRVPGLVYADERMLDSIVQDQALDQVANVAFLPGIVKYSMAMPDIHWGYGFPIGGVAATRVSDGVVSPGGVGFDINCGVRLLRSDLRWQDLENRVKELADAIFHNVPSGVGSHGRVRLVSGEIDDVARRGASWAVERGLGAKDDLECIESKGRMPGADPSQVSHQAKTRGGPQLGTLGSGNHFLEVQTVDEIFDPEAAKALGIESIGQVTVFIHTGSRGFGHQVCTDYLKVMESAARRYDIRMPDRQLACAPVESPEGRSYLAAMWCGANFAWANRQCITHWVRESFTQVLGRSLEDTGMGLVYDVAHNIAKLEDHVVDGVRMRLCVHRKGATRAFPPGHPDLAERYRALGQPVLIPGDMGRYSYLLRGTEEAMAETFGSTCHGAGRMQSRGAARRSLQGVDIARRLADQGITVRAQNPKLLAEEASEAYKDVASVVDVVDRARLARKVARFRPRIVIKG